MLSCDRAVAEAIEGAELCVGKIERHDHGTEASAVGDHSETLHEDARPEGTDQSREPQDTQTTEIWPLEDNRAKVGPVGLVARLTLLKAFSWQPRLGFKRAPGLRGCPVGPVVGARLAPGCFPVANQVTQINSSYFKLVPNLAQVTLPQTSWSV